MALIRSWSSTADLASGGEVLNILDGGLPELVTRRPALPKHTSKAETGRQLPSNQSHPALVAEHLARYISGYARVFLRDRSRFGADGYSERHRTRVPPPQPGQLISDNGRRTIPYGNRIPTLVKAASSAKGSAPCQLNKEISDCCSIPRPSSCWNQEYQPV